jgi:hypothetical protein
VQRSDLKHGDRGHDRDYSSGTAHIAGPVWLLITWDTPNSYLHHRREGMTRHLTQLARSATTLPQTQCNE